MYEAILYNAVVYISLCIFMVAITKHGFLNIFQTKPFSNVKFAMDYEKKKILPAIPKSQKVWKAVERNRTGFL